jgi:hypothetical protein
MIKVQKIIFEEHFYGVRVQGKLFISYSKTFISQKIHVVAGALSKITNPLAMEILGTMLLAENDPQAMFPIATACHIRDASLRHSLLEFLKRKDLPYRAQATGIESLAAQHQPQDLAYILDFCKDPNRVGQHGLIRAGAIRALASTRTEEAFDYLVDMIQNPLMNPERCRSWLFSSLASCAVWLSSLHVKKATEILVDGLAEEDSMVRWRCILGLVTLEAKSSIPAILSTESLWDVRDFYAVRKKVRDLKESVGAGIGLTPQKVKDMLKQMEEMEARLIKMEGLQKQREAIDKLNTSSPVSN